MPNYVSDFFEDLDKKKYKHELSEKLLSQVKKSYLSNGILGLQELIDRIHGRYMGENGIENRQDTA